MIAALSAETLNRGLLQFAVFLISLCVHEWAHAWSADKLGDPTARSLGRVTLNPIAHVDPIGTILFPLLCAFLFPGGLLFGWAKPVPFVAENFRRPKLDYVFVALAGPLSNLVLAFLASVAGHLVVDDYPLIARFFALAVLLNVLLAVFNMIPIPPLDGSHVLRLITRMPQILYRRLSLFGIPIVMGIFWFPVTRELFWTAFGFAVLPFKAVFPELLDAIRFQ